uniref:Aminotransferase-like plant mobile domain-containing protein n=1 Tax=Triticum urartu TaxID=4572 RepID=A0A8R7U309_TRIUA
MIMILELSHFKPLTSSENQLHSGPSLLTSLGHRWRPETHTFHFLLGELAPTLKDVSMITALPIRG